jgi:hypothetical protein
MKVFLNVVCSAIIFSLYFILLHAFQMKLITCGFEVTSSCLLICQQIKYLRNLIFYSITEENLSF